MTNQAIGSVDSDAYGFSRAPETIEPLPYGRFRNVYLYITDECQLRCKHCYMGERLDLARLMPVETVTRNMVFWRHMGGRKLSILGGEPTLHPDFATIVRTANSLGYEKVILNTNGLASARRILGNISPEQFAYVQVSIDGGAPISHDKIRGPGTFRQACKTTEELCVRSFDTRIICTVNKVNIGDCLELLPLADKWGVSLVKYHVFSGIGLGGGNTNMLISPREWIDFYHRLEERRGNYKTQVWYQPTYAYRSELSRFSEQGYRGCIGRTLDRISVFPDGRAYVCSYLFDTSLNYAVVDQDQVRLNKGENEFDLFTRVLEKPSCGSCKSPATCVGGCPAEELALGGSSCGSDPDIVPVCRLWKADI